MYAMLRNKSESAERSIMSVVKNWLVTLNIDKLLWFLNVYEFSITHSY